MKSVKEIVSARPLRFVKSSSKIIDIVKYMSEENIGLVPVLEEDGKLIGVFSERDLVRRVIAKGLSLEETSVNEVMSKNLTLSDINESYEACLKKMKEANIRHILIIDDKKLVGLVSVRDLLEIDITAQKETIEVLNNYIYSA
ncbi:MAG: CBS domain-containing protein [bacterium]